MAPLFLLLLPFSLGLFTETLHTDLMIGGAKADNPQIGFYGTTKSAAAPGVVFDADLGGWKGAVELSGKRGIPFSLISSFFWGQWSSSKRIGDGEEIDYLMLVSIDGSGQEIALPLNQKARYQLEEWISDSAFMGRFFLEQLGPFRLLVKGGPALLYRLTEHCCGLVDHLTGDKNGSIREGVSSLFVGGRIGFELEVDPGFMTLQLIPEFTLYRGWHRFRGAMDFGENHLLPVSFVKQSERPAYDAKIRLLISREIYSREWGLELFAHFISYAPGIFNPRSQEDQAADLTNQNSTLWGGGIFLLF